MTKKDDRNEYIGIITITTVIILAVIALYLFLNRAPDSKTVATVPTETPAPINTP